MSDSSLQKRTIEFYADVLAAIAGIDSDFSGLATEATLASIDTKITITANGIKVDGSSVTQPISALALPLPAGASTSALQTSGNASLTAIAASVASVDTDFDVSLSSRASEATLAGVKTGTDRIPASPSQEHTTAASPSSVRLTDGTSFYKGLTDTELRASAVTVTANAGTNLNTSALALDSTLTGGTQKTKIVDSAGVNAATVSAAGAVKVDGSAVTQPVSIAATVTVTGPLTDTQLRASAVPISAATLPLPTGAATAANQATANASLSSIDGKITAVNTGAVTISSALPAGANTIGKVDQGTGGASAWKVDGSAVTQPVSAAALPLPSGAATEATLSSINGKLATNPSTGSGSVGALNAAVTVTPGGQSVFAFAVSGTFVATLGIEGSVDGTTYFPILGTIVGQEAQFVVGFMSATGLWVVNASGYKNIRIRAVAYTSGTATIAYSGTTGSQEVHVHNLDSDALIGTVVGQAASGAAKAGFPVQVGAVFNTTQPTVTTGQIVEAQATARGGRIVATGIDDFQVMKKDTSKATYSAQISSLAVAALATDIFTITGSASKTVRVTKIGITGTRTLAGSNDILLLKRSTADTAGTSTSPTVVPHDSSDAAGTAVVRAYTANPTLGILVGVFRSDKIQVPAAGGVGTLLEWVFGEGSAKCIVLRGTGEIASVSLGGITIAGGSFDIYIEWTEES